MNGKTDMREVSPTVSIVTVVRNDSDGICKTLESVKAQDYPHIETVIIDGASTDNTLDIIQENSPYIDYWSSEPDRGIYDAMNKGIRQANGELTLFLNAADTFPDSGTLQRFASSCYRHQEDNKPTLYLCCVETDRKVLKCPKLLWLKKYYMMPSYHQAILYPTALLKSEPFSEQYQIASDAYHFLRIRPLVCLVTCNIVLANYDTNGVSSLNADLLNSEYHAIYQKLGVPRVFRFIKRLHELHARYRELK